MAGLFQPLLEACHLATLEARRTGDLTGETAVDHLWIGGQQIIDTQPLGNGCRYEAVGCSDDQQKVALFSVLLQQCFRFGQDDRLDALMHEFCVPSVQLFR